MTPPNSHSPDSMVWFVKTKGCYCVAVYKPFDPLISPGQNCCLYCAEECSCIQCSDGVTTGYPFEDKQILVECNEPLCQPINDQAVCAMESQSMLVEGFSIWRPVVYKTVSFLSIF